MTQVAEVVVDLNRFPAALGVGEEVASLECFDEERRAVFRLPRAGLRPDDPIDQVEILEDDLRIDVGSHAVEPLE